MISSNSVEWRESLAAAFKKSSIFRVLGTFPTTDIIEIASNNYPDVIILEVNTDDPLPVISGINVKSPFSQLVIILHDPSNYDMFELVRSGIKGCLPVRLLPKQIVYAVELIVDAGVLCIPRFGQEYNGKRGTTETSLLLSSLTRRELDVLSLLGRGHTNQEIASDLYISESTVKSHLRSIFRKLGVKKRHEAQAIALQEGLSDSK
ncbi:response regulator transcription factor [Syntrophaceticus schinkii]|uniref:Transcriptional regulator, LuxR family n=1 Tax=Syntrophaceticus schinkii TaxID=499207 RepID=A0A0B7MK55_9FIRM|nr:response regulator transcription factor [Syntrophaceticus schinkii]CEO88296.1 Transcriptional regulator, LuxR family [Syntrophaceticus schinkii]